MEFTFSTSGAEYTDYDRQIGAYFNEATAAKEERDWSRAIQALKAAYGFAEKHGKRCDVKSYLRLPMYLHAAGKADEAWREFNHLLVEHCRTALDKELLYHGLARIHDKMRLFLQRQKKQKDKVVHGILAYFYDGIARYHCLERHLANAAIERRVFPKQKSTSREIAKELREELKERHSKSFYSEQFANLLKGTGKEKILEPLCKFVATALARFPQIDLRKVAAVRRQLFFPFSDN